MRGQAVAAEIRGQSMARMSLANDLEPRAEILSMMGRDIRKSDVRNPFTIDDYAEATAMTAPRMQGAQIKSLRRVDEGPDMRAVV